MHTIKELNDLYKQGVNISALLRKQMEVNGNSKEIIEISYDLQAGSYVKGMGDEKVIEHKLQYADELSRLVLELCSPFSILEAGVGEATTLSWVLQSLQSSMSMPKAYGFDLSCSRIFYARNWLESNGLPNVSLCTGDLSNMPYLDSSIDVVYTSHSIEPNGGNESAILQELYRVAGRYLILLEPAYELSSVEIQKRMDSHGYCKGLKQAAKSLGYKVIRSELFPYSINHMNPTGITIIEKSSQCFPVKSDDKVFACPKSKSALKEIDEGFYSAESGLVFPSIAGIPCLRIDNAILMTKYEDYISS